MFTFKLNRCITDLLELGENPVVQPQLRTHAFVFTQLLESLVEPGITCTSAKLEVNLASARLERYLFLPQCEAHQEQPL